MSKLKYFFSALSLVLIAGAISSCENDPPLPDITTEFETDALGFEGSETSVVVTLSREADVDVLLEITLAPVNIAYGTEFTTDPAATDNKLKVTIPAGALTGSFRVIKSTQFLDGDEKIDFTIGEPQEGIFLGTQTTMSLSFAAITSEGSTATLEGKTAESNYTNNVYYDLSANKAITVNRKSWNIAFLSGSDFKVILNPGYQTTAAPLTKTDIATVVAADAETVINLAHDALITDPATRALADSWDGDLTRTTFGTISANDSENKVFLLSFEGSKTKDKWLKVKVTRNGSGYRVQHAVIGETTIKTLDVPKSETHNLTFVSLESNSIVSVEPAKSDWDIQWGYSTGNSSPMYNTPYWIQDFILLNYLGGAEAGEVAFTTGADATANAALATEGYNNFNEASISTVTFLKTRDAIGIKWRSAFSGIFRDRFYVVKDPRGNVYKLKFVSFGVPAGQGERGRPVIEYKLVKKAG